MKYIKLNGKFNIDFGTLRVGVGVAIAISKKIYEIIEKN
jgi:hypothetical protein